MAIPSIADMGLERQEQQEPIEQVQQVVTDAKQARDLARESLDFLASLAMPLVYQYAYPPVLLALWQLLQGYLHKPRDFTKLALGLPRGFGKSTFLKLLVLYCILFTNKRFILVICATQQLAENIISDVASFLDEDNIKAVFGNWRMGMIKDTQALKRFGFCGRNITLQALGSGSSVRGINIDNQRPDVMIFDDVQTREEADSELQSTQLENWMIGTAMKAKSPHGCLFLFVANMYPTPHSILRKLKYNSTWIKFICGGILEDGTSLWEELHPIKQLIAEYESNVEDGKPEIFAAEVLNDENASANNLVDVSAIPPYPYSDDEIAYASYVIIDPSGYKKTSDAVSIGLVRIYNGKPVLTHVIEGNLNPKETIKESLRLCLSQECYHIFVEGVAYQSTLKFWFDEICQQLGIEGIEVMDIMPGRASKNTRILASLKLYQAGDIMVHPRAKAAVHAQIRDFNPLKTNNTDGILDILTYMTPVFTEYGEYIATRTPLNSHAIDAIPVLTNTSPF